MKLRNRDGGLVQASIVSNGADGLLVIRCVDGHDLCHDDGTPIVGAAVVSGSYVINRRERLKDHIKYLLQENDYTWRTLTALCVGTGLSQAELEGDYLPSVGARKSRGRKRLWGLTSVVGADRV